MPSRSVRARVSISCSAARSTSVVRVGGAVLQGVAGGDVEMDERVHARQTARAHRGAAARGRRTTGLEGAMRDQAQRGLDHPEEPVGVAHQVVGLALGDRPGRARLGRGALGGAGGEEARPLGQLGGDLGQQHPGVLLAAGRRGAPAGPGRPAGRPRPAARRRGRRRSGSARRWP